MLIFSEIEPLEGLKYGGVGSFLTAVFAVLIWAGTTIYKARYSVKAGSEKSAISHFRTLAQNLENRIAKLESRVETLEKHNSALEDDRRALMVEKEQLLFKIEVYERAMRAAGVPIPEVTFGSNADINVFDSDSNAGGS